MTNEQIISYNGNCLAGKVLFLMCQFYVNNASLVQILRQTCAKSVIRLNITTQVFDD